MAFPHFKKAAHCEAKIICEAEIKRNEGKARANGLSCQTCNQRVVLRYPGSKRSAQAKRTNSTSFLTRNEVELVPLTCEDVSASTEVIIASESVH